MSTKLREKIRQLKNAINTINVMARIPLKKTSIIKENLRHRQQTRNCRVAPRNRPASKTQRVISAKTGGTQRCPDNGVQVAIEERTSMMIRDEVNEITIEEIGREEELTVETEEMIINPENEILIDNKRYDFYLN